MSDLFATPDEEKAAGIAPAGDLFLSEDEERERGLIPDVPAKPEPVVPARSEPSRVPVDEDSLTGNRTVDDFVAGLGNTLNLDRGAVRVGRLLGLLSDQEARDTLERLDYEHGVRGDRGNAFGAGKLAGEVGVGVAAAPLATGAAGAAAVGAGMGATSEAARTGNVGDAALGAGMGALGGAVGHKAGQALGSVGEKLLARTPGGELAEAATRKAGQVGADLRALSGLGDDLPASRIVGEAYEEALTSAPPGIARLAAKGSSAVRRAAERGELGPQAMSDLATLLAKKAGAAAKPRPTTVWDVAAGLGGGVAKTLGAPSSVGGMVAGSRAAAAYNDDSGTAEAQDYSYSDLIDEGPTPLDDTRNENFDAMVSAYDSPALQSYPGLAQDLSAMLQGWAMGEEPDPAQVALMTYRLSEVPGLGWAELDPARQPEATDDFYEE